MAKEETALVVLEPTTALDVFTEAGKVDTILAQIKQIVAEFTPDISTAKGRAEIASIAHKVARSKTYLDGIGKELVDQYKEIPKKIDANRKRIRDELDALKDEVRKPLTEWEEAEKARVQFIKDRINGFYAMASMPKDSVTAGLAIKDIEGVAIDESFGEFAAEAATVKDKVLVQLRAGLEVYLKHESEQAELARLREEAAKREQEERDRKIAEAAAEKARRDAEEKAAREKAEAERKAKEEREAAERRELELKLAAERAERERLEAIERAEREKQAAIEAERKRQAEAERQKQAEIDRINAEADRRAADLANRNRVHLEIRDYLIAQGIEDDVAATVVSLLSLGCPHVEVRY